MVNEPKISVIVTTKNNHATLQACLKSIAAQTFQNMELIVVDNNSTDDTKDIAGEFTPHVYNKGPERSTQRNYGASKATGDHLFIIDSDMELDPLVVEQCVEAVEANPTLVALVVPEESFGIGFWAQCKKLERSFYVGQGTIEAARFFNKAIFKDIGGYNTAMTGGEDWDLTRRMKDTGQHGRVEAYIHHNEGHPTYTRTASKMYYYAQHAAAYFAENPTKSPITDKSGPLARYKLFLSQPAKLFRDPILGLGMLFLKTTEYAAAGFGHYQAKLQRPQTPARSTSEITGKE